MLHLYNVVVTHSSSSTAGCSRPTLTSVQPLEKRQFVCHYSLTFYSNVLAPVWGWGTPLPPLSIYFLIFSPFHFSLSFIGVTYFLLLSIPSLSIRIVPLRFQARGRRRRPNLVLVCFLFCTLCYLYSLVKMYCGALFYLV